MRGRLFTGLPRKLERRCGAEGGLEAMSFSKRTVSERDRSTSNTHLAKLKVVGLGDRDKARVEGRGGKLALESVRSLLCCRSCIIGSSQMWRSVR